MNNNPSPLGDLTPDEFLKDYWQKKTLVIHNAFPDFQCPISAEELAGLACEEDVNSRIVIEKDGEHPWQPIYGPMDDDVFNQLPDTHWTLLVNDVEKHIPELAWILDMFRFIPEWRMDDLMISYAPEGGSVGPHMDLYDVFILQAQGHRRWQINTQPVNKDNQVKNTPLRVQRHFTAEEEWLLKPGDIIYIPPGVSHYGVATDDCMSFSIGFRSPCHADLVNDFTGYITQSLDPSLVYTDTDLTLQQYPNEITAEVEERVKSIFKEYLRSDHPEIRRWLGRYMSDTKADVIYSPEQPVDSYDEIPDELYRNPASRFAFIRHAGSCKLYIDGEEFHVSEIFAVTLCDKRDVSLAEISNIATAPEQELLVELYNNGKLIDTPVL